jgi:Asp-tRNA(Asn)/Glu-tRNA(Gln) amidotransferase C subunit
LLFNLNALSETHLDEADYEKRFEAFKTIIKMEKSIKSIPPLSILPIMANLLFYLKDSQWIIRDNSSKSIESIIKHISNLEGKSYF